MCKNPLIGELCHSQKIKFAQKVFLKTTHSLHNAGICCKLIFMGCPKHQNIRCPHRPLWTIALTAPCGPLPSPPPEDHCPHRPLWTIAHCPHRPPEDHCPHFHSQNDLSANREAEEHFISSNACKRGSGNSCVKLLQL